MHKENLSAREAMARLEEGNKRYLSASTNPGDISLKLRKATCENGQSPYAIVITCSDSRVVPEDIFTAGIGELFVIRVAGNVMDHHQLGSVEVLGHDHCGAVGAAIHDEPSGFVKYITDEIRRAIGDEKDDFRASCLNVKQSVSVISESLGIKDGDEVSVVGAIYHIEDGAVEFL